MILKYSVTYKYHYRKDAIQFTLTFCKTGRRKERTLHLQSKACFKNKKHFSNHCITLWECGICYEKIECCTLCPEHLFFIFAGLQAKNILRYTTFHTVNRHLFPFNEIAAEVQLQKMHNTYKEGFFEKLGESLCNSSFSCFIYFFPYIPCNAISKSVKKCWMKMFFICCRL